MLTGIGRQSRLAAGCTSSRSCHVETIELRDNSPQVGLGIGHFCGRYGGHLHLLVLGREGGHSIVGGADGRVGGNLGPNAHGRCLPVVRHGASLKELAGTWNLLLDHLRS